LIDLKRPKSGYVIGPNGKSLTLGDLPRLNRIRWVARHKANVVAAIRGGLISINEARERYSLTMEELESLEKAFDREGIRGLRVTRRHDTQE
jgi:Protein of unknown function (DUF1153)